MSKRSKSRTKVLDQEEQTTQTADEVNQEGSRGNIPSTQVVDEAAFFKKDEEPNQDLLTENVLSEEDNDFVTEDADFEDEEEHTETVMVYEDSVDGDLPNEGDEDTSTETPVFSKDEEVDLEDEEVEPQPEGTDFVQVTINTTAMDRINRMTR